MRGLFSVDRRIFQDPFFKDEPYTEREAWLWLISEASYKNRQVRTKRGVVNLERGQLTSSSRFMAEKWQWKEPRVRRFLKRLKIDAAIDTINDAAQNIITICNYDIYQDFSEYGDAVRDAENDARATQYRRSSDANKNTRITPEGTPEETPESAREISPRFVADLWNEICAPLNPVNSLSLDRENKITNLTRSTLKSEADWRAFFGKVMTSPFLRGERDSFVANFDWCINPRNAAKIDSGNYDPRPEALPAFDPYKWCEENLTGGKYADR